MVVRLSACVHVFMCSVQHSNSGNSNNNNNTLAQRASRKALMAAEAPPCRGVVICVVHCRPQQYLISRSDVCAEVYLWFFCSPTFPSLVPRSGACRSQSLILKISCRCMALLAASSCLLGQVLYGPVYLVFY